MEQGSVTDLNRTEILDTSEFIQVSDRHPYLIIFIGSDGGQRHKLKRGKMTVGRSNQADITINDQRISRIHCVIEWVGDTIIIEDKGSTNGIFYDSKKVTNAVLQPGVPIQLGQSVMKIEYKDEAEIQAEENLLRKVSTDSLTGIFSRQHFNELAAMEMAYACRHQQVVGMIMLDIDNFQHVLDTYDAQTGDFVITRFTEIINQTIRTEDLFGRYNDEEFVIMPRGVVTPEDVSALCERIRNAVKNHTFQFGEDSIKITVSLGYHLEKVKGREPNDKLVDMISQAAQALYLAKDRGRDRTESLF
jgi:diguanylate cyclase (GGDEF)-like protein